MRLRRFAVLGAVGSAAVVSGCAGGGTQETILFTSTQWVPGEAAGTPTASSAAASEAAESATTPAAGAWKNEYAWVLDHPGDYPVNSAARYDPVGTYHYALVEMTGDDTPEMLLMVDSKEYSPIIVFTVGADGKAAGSTDVLIAGASGAGGSRARVEASESGNGLYQVDSNSVQPDAYSKLYKLSGRSLTAASDSVEFENADLLPDHRFIAWTKSTDRSALHAGKPTYAGATSITEYTPFPDAAPEKVAPDKVAPAKPASSAVGTVRDMSGEELAALAGDFQYGPEERYLVLHLDEVAAISGIRGAESSPSTVTTQTILLGTKTQGANFKLAGRRIELSLDPDITRFANDPSAPYASAIVPPTDGFVYLD